MVRPWRLALVAGALLACAVPAQAQRPHARPVDAVDAIVERFEHYPVVALGEDHGNVAQHRFLRRLVADPRLARVADAIVIEAGSARHQDVVDRFVAGEALPREDLAATWRDSIGGGYLGTWDAPLYEQFLRTVRRVNRARPAAHRLRVLLGDPPVAWEDVRTPEDLERWSVTRDAHYASVVDREVLRKGLRALLVAGVYHLQRDPDAPFRSALMEIDRLHPGKTYAVTLPPFDPAAEFGAPFDYTRAFRADSLVSLRGTDLGELRRPRPPGAPQAPTQEEAADAWFIPDPALRGVFSNLYPTAYSDAWWVELERRHRIAFGTFDPGLFFSHHCSYGSFQGRGLRQSAEAGPLSREPRPGVTAPGGPAPEATGAVAAIVERLAAGKVVLIGDATAMEQEHAVLAELLESGRLPGRRPVIVVGFGNGAHQQVVDEYVAGGDVPVARLARAWQDTSQLLAYDAPPYEAFFASVRAANAGLPPDRRIRVLLGEPPLDWSRVSSGTEVRQVAARRAVSMARIAQRHRARGRSVLVVAERRLVARAPGSVTDRLPAGSTWVLQPYAGFAVAQAALERRLEGVAAGSVLTVGGSWLEGLWSGANLSPEAPARPLGRTADALLFTGTSAALETATPFPTLFRDRYVRELRRRHRVLFGTPLDEATAFPTSHCSAPAQSVGEERGPAAGDAGD